MVISPFHAVLFPHWTFVRWVRRWATPLSAGSRGFPPLTLTPDYGRTVDKETLFSFSWLRVVYFNIFVVAFLITEIGRNVYRPYIYENGIADYGIADSIGNLMGVVTQIFFSLALLHCSREKGLRVIAFIMGGYVVYELMQPYLPRGVFDRNDLVGTIVGGIAAAVIFLALHAVADQRAGRRQVSLDATSGAGILTAEASNNPV